MKVYAVIIGKEKPYIAWNAGRKLAVYDYKYQATERKKDMLHTCGHKEVYVIKLVSQGGRLR